MARWFSFEKADTATEVNKGQKLVWDESKLYHWLSSVELEDELLLRNIANGSILSGKMWPILIDSTPANSPSRTRSLEFLKEFVNIEDVSKCLSELNSNERAGLAVTIRDLWLAKHYNLLSSEPDHIELCHLLDQALDKFENAMAPETEIDLLPVSFCPTRTRKVLRFTLQLDELLEDDHEFHGCAAQYGVEGFPQPYIAVWVDPRDLSYHNFENILPLDRALQADINGELELEMDELRRLHPSINIFSGVIKGRDAELLPKLGNLNLYQEPSNSNTRGGQRFVFSSAALSKALTAAVKQSGLLYLLSNKPIPESFSESDTYSEDDSYEEDTNSEIISDDERYGRQRPQFVSNSFKLINTFKFVNYVIRCNRFQPSDDRFELHRDTPYYDSARSHISKYTMIIYLKGQKGESSILNIFDDDESSSFESGDLKPEPGFSLNAVEDMQFVVFEQRYRHEGLPYISGEKVFLRTELIFEEKNVTHNNLLGPLFGSAVYFTTETAFQPEMAAYATELYERVNQAHWALSDYEVAQNRPPTLPVLRKCYDGEFHFATNGSDYWFPYPTENTHSIEIDIDYEAVMLVNLKVCALVAVLDYFNGKIAAEGTKLEPLHPFESFRRKCTSKVITDVPAKGSSVDHCVLTQLWNSFGEVVSEDSQESNECVILLANSSEKDDTYGSVLRESCKDHGKMPLQSLRGKFPFNEPTDADSAQRQKKRSDSQCCAYHAHEFRAWKCGSTVRDFTTAAGRVLNRLKRTVAFIMDSKLVIDDEMILVNEDKIHIGGFEGEKPTRVNFAACWTDGYRESAYVQTKPWSKGVSFTLPPIPFVPVLTEDGKQGFRLTLDFFKNDWMVASNTLDLPLINFTNQDRYIT